MTVIARRPFTAALFLAVTLLAAPRAAHAVATPSVIEVTAKRFAFSPSVVTLKAGAPAILRVHSEDVTHGFFSRALGIDETLEPGKTFEVAVTPKAPGRYDVICDHFCGAGHGNMKMTVVVE